MDKLDCVYIIMFGVGTLFGVGITLVYFSLSKSSNRFTKKHLTLIKGGKK